MGLQARLITTAGRRPRPGKKAFGVVSGTRIDIWYSPGPKDASTKIVFIQVMRELLDIVPSLPSELDPDFKYQNADTTASFYHVDYFASEKDPYYTGDDPQDKAVGRQGTTVPTILFVGYEGVAPLILPSSFGSAWMWDRPSYDPDNLKGKPKMKYEFRSAAYSAAGADAGTYYCYQDWTYEMDKDGKEKTTLGLTGLDPGQDFKDAVDLWCNNRGFKLPTPPPPPPPVYPSPYGARKHVVVLGDYLQGIAQRFYGDSNLWPRIYDANRAVIGPDPNFIFPGQTLVIP